MTEKRQLAQQVAVNRNYKDTLFRMIFKEKDKLLSLYNAVNGTQYKDVGDLRVNTLENAVYLTMKNDISFVFDFYLNLYEHQSTYNGNMPLRNLLYIARVFEDEIGDQSLYTAKVVRIPTPTFIVFYNGLDEKPEQWVEKLSLAFEKEVEHPRLELEVLMLNVNYGKNQEIMEQCRTLKEYALYVEKVRKYADQMEINEAVERAVNESINEGILKDFLTRYRAEAMQVSIFEYDEEKEREKIRRAEYQIGHEEGERKGKAEGKAEQLVAIIRKLRCKGMSTADIVAILDEKEEIVQSIIELLENGEQLDDVKIAEHFWTW